MISLEAAEDLQGMQATQSVGQLFRRVSLQPLMKLDVKGKIDEWQQRIVWCCHEQPGAMQVQNLKKRPWTPAV